MVNTFLTVGLSVSSIQRIPKTKREVLPDIVDVKVRSAEQPAAQHRPDPGLMGIQELPQLCFQAFSYALFNHALHINRTPASIFMVAQIGS